LHFALTLVILTRSATKGKDQLLLPPKTLSSWPGVQRSGRPSCYSHRKPCHPDPECIEGEGPAVAPTKNLVILSAAKDPLLHFALTLVILTLSAAKRKDPLLLPPTTLSSWAQRRTRCCSRQQPCHPDPECNEGEGPAVAPTKNLVILSAAKDPLFSW